MNLVGFWPSEGRSARSIAIGSPPNQTAGRTREEGSISALRARLDVNIRVSDLERSVAWYARVFDAEPIYRGVDRTLDGAHSTTLVCFRLGRVNVWLLPGGRTEELGAHEHHNLAISFMTPTPLLELRETLEARGARFDDETQNPNFPVGEAGVRVGKDAEFMYVFDPDNNRLEFCRTFDSPGATTE